MIQFIGVNKVYPASPQPIRALDNVSFEIGEGEFTFLVGPSGSGKTTILKQIIREEVPDDGRIYIYDDEITKYNRKQTYLLRRNIGIIFQDYKLIDDKNSYENIAFAMEAAGQSKSEIAETVPYVLDVVGLSDRVDAFPRELSGGEKQRIAIARSIANNPKILIADEPTGNLDPSTAWDIIQILLKINKWGTTVIMSTHGTDIVNSLQKRVLQMQNGKLVRDDKSGLYDKVDGIDADLKKTSEEKEKKDKKKEEIKEEKKKIKIKSEVEEQTDENTAPSEISESAIEPIVEEKQVDIEVALEKADESDLKSLKLSKALEDKLLKQGYKDVEDILSAGISKVNEGLEKTEIKQLARKIKKFLTME